MRLLLLVNGAASSVTARARVVIQKALSSDHDVEVALTSRRGHATRLAMKAAKENFDVLVVLGGDGTLNEAANGLAGTSTRLGVLPGGSTNVFARTIGMTNDPLEATGELLNAIARDNTREVGLGNVNGRYFVFHVGMGFDAAVVAQVERRGALKRYAGHPLFVWTAVNTWLNGYDRSRPRLRVEFPEGETIEDGYFAIALKTNPYTFLGSRPLNLAPEATLDRGLAVLTIKTLRPFTMMGLIGSALGRGRHLRHHSKVDYRVDLEALTVTGLGPLPYQVDGDYLGEADRLEFRWEPKALTLYVP